MLQKAMWPSMWIPVTVGLLPFVLPFAAAAPAPTGAGTADTPLRAHAILAQRCFSCHGAAGLSGLDLRSRATALHGGKRGAAILPGKPEESLLYRTISGKEALRMPPSGTLGPEEQRTLHDWIQAGAAWPSGGPAASDSWTLSDLKRPRVPQPRDRSWVRNPIDAFVLAKLEEKGLRPAPPADRKTLIRRVSFDLTGLPPDPAEVERFVQDRAPDAYARMVDRYLASPRYGERWARHWLDVVRFAESQGFERDKIRDNSWRYRDYVIRSFNADKPYDQFVREQIAGDVLPQPTHDSIVATGFLVAGPWDEVGNTQASSAMRARVREDELEDMVSATSQTFLGLTVNCARCHNHKFDPIPQRDYYRIQAALAGVRHGERPVLTPAEETARREKDAALAEQSHRLEGEIAALDQEGYRRAESDTRPVTDTRHVPEPALRWSFARGAREQVAGLDLSLVGDARVTDGRLQVAGSGAYARSAPVPFAIGAKTLEAWVDLASLDQGGGSVLTLEDDHGLVFDGIVFGERQPRKWIAGSNSFVRTRDLEAPGEDSRPGSLVHVAVTYSPDGRVTVYRNGRPYGDSYLPPAPTGAGPLQAFRAGEWHVLFGLRHLAAGAPSARSWLKGSIAEARIYNRDLSPAELLASFRQGPKVISEEVAVAHLTPAEAARRKQLHADLDSVRAEVARAVTVPLVYAAHPEAPPAVFVLTRGDINQKAEEVSAGGLSCLRQLSSDFGLDRNAPDAERRRKLADWLCDPHNPLPARVMANRVWQYHFGRGIVGTPSDFGVNGDPPSHPELLDWLASEFASGKPPKPESRVGVKVRTEPLNTAVLPPTLSPTLTPGPQLPHSHTSIPLHSDTATGSWSIKRLHRLILLSNTYQQSSRYDARAAAVDADDRLLWRMAPRRLEAEEIRDTMLSLSGQLNLAEGGPGFRPFSVVVNNSNFYTYEDRVGPEYNRRSIYRTIVNSGGVPLLETFDCPDPSTKTPKRSSTTTPLQALSLFNNSFVFRQSRELAARLEREAGADPARQVDRAYRLAFSRAPQVDEVTRDAAFIRRYGLPAYARVLLNTSELLFVR